MAIRKDRVQAVVTGIEAPSGTGFHFSPGAGGPALNVSAMAQLLVSRTRLLMLELFGVPMSGKVCEYILTIDRISETEED